MRPFVTRARFLVPALLALALPLAAFAQPGIDPTWDHYKVYQVTPPITRVFDMVLIDQFQVSTHTATVLERFMNPTEKHHAGVPPSLINDPRLHYAWWRITPTPWNEAVVATNQFGPQTLQVLDAEWLLNPAVKNEPVPGPPLPVENHYKCYNCTGQPINLPLVLNDQFGTWQTQAIVPRYLCNPVEKRVPALGEIHPIVDPREHLVCYEFTPPDPRIFPATLNDQFLRLGPTQTVELGNSRFLCVPSLKDRPTSERRNTWGTLKLLYR